MGQNGAGKSSIFKMITRELEPIEGSVFCSPVTHHYLIRSSGHAKEMLTVEYFTTTPMLNILLNKKIQDIFEIVNLALPLEKNSQNFQRTTNTMHFLLMP